MKVENGQMDYQQRNRNHRLWFEWAQLVIGLFVPLTIIIYTVIQNNTEIAIARDNRQHDLKIADERHEQEIFLSNDQQEEATLIRYFDSLGKLLEHNEKLGNKTNIARFKTLTALAQLNSKRKGFLIRSLIENRLITMNNGRNSILDISLADLTGLDLTEKMLGSNKLWCTMLHGTTLTNASFRAMELHGSTFEHSHSGNSDFSSSYAYPFSCGTGDLIGINFKGAVLDRSNFDDAKYMLTSFSRASLSRVRMRRFKCSGCQMIGVNMNSIDFSDAQFSSYSYRNPIFQLSNMSSALLYKAKFTDADFALTRLTMINATETIFNTSIFILASLANSSFVKTIIVNSTFYMASLRGSSWDRAKVTHTSFYKADMTHVNFINSECHYCLFNQTQLADANFTNSSLDGSNFRRANVTHKQLLAARSLRSVILPDGTVIQPMTNNHL